MIALIDLRSDTLTRPTPEMLEAMIHADVGDDSRGEDPTVKKLEELAANITGKEAALFCNSGTMANIIALLTHCKRGDRVAIDPFSHIYRREKSLFKEEYFGLRAVFYETDTFRVPQNKKQAKLMCLENSIAYTGGTCISITQTNEICETAKIPIHIDGARIFNVAAHFNIPVKKLIENVDSVQFCLSKGLGAPIGSMLCGSSAFIERAKEIRKIIGGGMRQAGIIAAAGIVALQNTPQLKIDNEHTSLLARKILHNSPILHLDLETVQTNIIIAEVSNSGYMANIFAEKLKNRGLQVRAISDTKIRMVIYREITKEKIDKAAEIINQFCKEILLDRRNHHGTKKSKK